MSPVSSQVAWVCHDVKLGDRQAAEETGCAWAFASLPQPGHLDLGPFPWHEAKKMAFTLPPQALEVTNQSPSEPLVLLAVCQAILSLPTPLLTCLQLSSALCHTFKPVEFMQEAVT